MHKVFMYGTLKRGHGNYKRLLEGHGTYLGNARTESIFTMLDLGSYPGIVEDGTTQIAGELFEVDDETLARLDRLEGHPTHYKRSPVALTMDDGALVPAEVYILQDRYRRGEEIPSGVWS